LSELGNSLNFSALYSEQAEKLDPSYFSVDHPKTKEAEEFVKRMRKDQLRMKSVRLANI
jgi:hypothetical protein